MAQNFNLASLGGLITVNTAANTATYSSSLVVGNSSVNVAITSANILANSVLVVANSMATSIATGATANGSTQTTAYPITTTSVQFTTVASGTGAILPTCVPGQRIFIANDGANQLLLYPAAGGVIDQAAANAAVTIAAGGMWEGMALTSINWTSISPDTQGTNGIVVTQSNGAVIATVNSAYIATLSANNASYLNSQPSSYYTNATNITTGTLPYAQLGANVVNTSSAFTITGVHTYNANLVMSTTAGISANGGYGTSGQVLTSNGTTVYWSTVSVPAGGSNTYVQFNNSGALGGSSSLTFNSATGVLNPSILSVGTGSFNTRRANFANGELTFIPYSAAEGASTNTYFMNLCDSGGNNGGSMQLYVRGLATSGSAQATLAAVTMATTSLNVTGDVITNYSDIRLKDVSGPIVNALDKVSQIDPFYYTPNQRAVDMGVDIDMRSRAGVSAQQMQELFPEVVRDAPVGEGYLTVQYDRIVPLLIAAIKELREEIKVLKETK